MAGDDKNTVKWYVVGAPGVHREIRVRDSLRKAGLESYVPLRYEIQRVKKDEVRKMVPAITGLIFVKTSYEAFQAYSETSRDRLFLRKAAYSDNGSYLTVHDKDMERFIALTEQFQKDITYFKPDEVTLHEGELVEIQLGTKTYEAEIKRVRGKRSKQLVVEIPEVTTAAITLTPELMKMITRHSSPLQESQRQQREHSRQKKLEATGRSDRRKTRNLEEDKRQMTETAKRLLFEVTDTHQEDAENHLAMLDLLRLYQRLDGSKGVLPSLEGELALAMYLAAMKLNVDVEKNTERLRKAIAQLKDASTLKLRLRFFLARLSGDSQELESILSEVRKWNRLRLSARQKQLVEEIDRCGAALSSFAS